MAATSWGLRLPLALAGVLASAGCLQSYPVLVDQAAQQAQAQAAQQAQAQAAAAAAQGPALVEVSGLVLAPAGIVATGGGNIVATGGGNIVATGGGNIVATGGGNLAAGVGHLGTRQLMGVSEKPLAGAQVFLANAKGEPLPHTPHANTDKDGTFKLGQVPAGFTFVVAVKAKDGKGHDVTLQALTHTDAQGGKAKLSMATTCVTLAALQGHDNPGDIDPAAFDAATAEADQKLTDQNAPDPADHDAQVKWMGDLEGKSATLHDALTKLKAQVTGPHANPADPTTFFPQADPAPAGPPASQAPTQPGTAPTPLALVHPPLPSTAPGELPLDPIAGVLQDTGGQPVAGQALVFKPRGSHHETYAPVTTDAMGLFKLELRFATLPDGFDVFAGSANLGIWSLSPEVGLNFPHSFFSATADAKLRVQVIY